MYRLCLRVTEKEKEAFLIQGDLGFAWDTGPWPAAWSQPPAFSSENMPLGIWGSLPENALCPKSQRFTWCKTLSKVGSKERVGIYPRPLRKAAGGNSLMEPWYRTGFLNLVFMIAASPTILPPPAPKEKN